VGEALGRSQGGFSTKLHLRAEGGGKPIAAVLTAGERHEQFALDALMDKGAVPRLGRGRPRLRPRRTAGDRGYSSPPARCRLRQRRIEPVIPSRKDQPGTVRNSVCGRRVEHQAAMARVKRSPKMTANCALAMTHSRGPIFHAFSERFKTR